MKLIIKFILIFFGSIFLFIGFFGLFVPVMPTSPFLIIAGLCYINSSKKLYERLILMKFFGKHVENYVEHKMIERRFKVISLVTLWISTLITIFFIVDNVYVEAGSIVFGVLISLHIISLTSKQPFNKEKGVVYGEKRCH